MITPGLAQNLRDYGAMLGILFVAITQKVNAIRTKKTAASLALALDNSTAARDEKLREIHALVNSAMAKQLRIAVAYAERLALITGDPVDRQAATDARKDYESHMARQAMVDKLAIAAASAPVCATSTCPLVNETPG